jgi:hypothetical protein
VRSPLFIGVCAIQADADIEGARRNHAVLSKANPSNRELDLNKLIKRHDDETLEHFLERHASSLSMN